MKKQTNIKRISLLITAYSLALFTLFLGFIFVFVDIFGGLVLTAAGLLILPVFYRSILKKYVPKFAENKVLVSVIAFVLFLVGIGRIGMVNPGTDSDSSKDTEIAQVESRSSESSETESERIEREQREAEQEEKVKSEQAESDRIEAEKQAEKEAEEQRKSQEAEQKRSQEAEEERIEEERKASEEAQREAEKNAEKIQNISGNSDSVKPLEMEDGLAVFEFNHVGNSNFAIKFLNSDGDMLDLLVNEIGAYRGFTALNVPSSGKYFVDVTASGAWSGNITQNINFVDNGKSLNGSGDGVKYVELDKGLSIFKSVHTGSSNFAVKLLDKNGNMDDLLVNEIGSYNGEDSSKISKDNFYVLTINADGEWNIEID